MSTQPFKVAVASIADLFAAAYQIEADAVERYMLLADQMETHNNLELMKVFRDLARAEGIHAEEISSRPATGPVDHARKMGLWRSATVPRRSTLDEAHYLMTPWHALQLRARWREARACILHSRS